MQQTHRDVTPHLWLGSFQSTPDRYPENILAFAERHDMTIVRSCWNTTPSDAERLEADMQVTSNYDIDVWLGTYDLREYSDRELVNDNSKLDKDLDRLKRIVDTYAEYYPDGNVFLWHEAPLTGQWTGETRGEQAESIRRYGPPLFAAQKRAIAERHSALDVGIMLHFPYLAPPEHSAHAVFGPLIDELRDRGAAPDFTYFDFYRRHTEWTSGYDASNTLLRSVIENVRSHTGNRPIHYLGEAHTANNGYTPSKQAMLGNLRTALEAGVDSYGWLDRKGFVETKSRNYTPFVPNVGTPDINGQFRTSMGARDRFNWASLLLLNHVMERRSDDLFDLWIHARNLNFYEYAVSMQTHEGEWEFVGDVSGYPDGDTPYSGDDRDRICAIRALDRDHYINDGELKVRIEPTTGADGATLYATYAMPHADAARYATEPELTDLCGTSDLKPYSLGAVIPDIELSSEDGYRGLLETSPPDVPLTELPIYGSRKRSLQNELRELERQAAPRGLFDLWMYGRNLGGNHVRLGGEDVEEHRSHEGGADGDVEAVIYRGLERFEHFETHTSGRALPVSIEAGSTTELRGVFAMPYHGADNLVTSDEVASLIHDDYECGEGEIATFSIAHRTWPTGARLEAGESLMAHLQYYPRSIRDATLEFEDSDV